MAASPNAKVNPDDVVSVRIMDDDPPLVVEDPAPGTDSVDVDDNNSLTPFEKMSQKLYDSLRAAYNLDPTGELRAVAVVVSIDNGKTWKIVEDATEDSVYLGQEIWSKSYVEAEVAKTKTAYSKAPV